MKTCNLIPFLFLACQTFLHPADAPAELTPEQAVKVLQTSNDLEELTNAVEVATANPSTRQAVIEFLDGASKKELILNDYLQKHLPASSEILANPDALTAWELMHSEEVNSVKADLTKIEDKSPRDLGKFFADSNDPGTFEVFKHLAFSRSMGAYWGDDMGPNLKPGSVQEPLYLDFNEYLITQTVQVTYVDAGGNKTYAGIMDKNTGQFVEPALSPDELAKAKSGKEESMPTFGNLSLRELTTDHSDAAFSRAENLILSDKISHDAVTNFIFDPLVGRRYKKSSIAIYEKVLNYPDENDRSMAVGCLFYIRWGSEGPLPPQLEDADPSVYPYLMHFIWKAEKLKVNDEATKLLADNKAKLLALYAQHGLTPPTDAELAAMPAIVIPPPPATTAPVKASGSARSTAPTVEASPLPLYVIGGTVVVLVAAVILLRRK